MDLANFVHLLETRALHLAALRAFSDPFEGPPPRSVIASMSVQPAELTPEVRAERLAVIEKNLGFFKNSRQLLFASCWHMNEGESAGMWAQYIRTGEGIAVQTTFARLKSAIAPDSRVVSGGVAQYVDFETHVLEHINVLLWGVLKRISYHHEREFRLISVDPTGLTGLSLPVDLSQLVENVYVAPTTPDWLYDLLVSLLVRYGLAVPVLRSGLLNAPKYFVVPEWAARET